MAPERLARVVPLESPHGRREQLGFPARNLPEKGCRMRLADALGWWVRRRASP